MKFLLSCLVACAFSSAFASQVLNCSGPSEDKTYFATVDITNTYKYQTKIWAEFECAPRPLDLVDTTETRAEFSGRGPSRYSGPGFDIRLGDAEIVSRAIPGDDFFHEVVSQWVLKVGGKEVELTCINIGSALD